MNTAGARAIARSRATGTIVWSTIPPSADNDDLGFFRWTFRQLCIAQRRYRFQCSIRDLAQGDNCRTPGFRVPAALSKLHHCGDTKFVILQKENVRFHHISVSGELTLVRAIRR